MAMPVKLYEGDKNETGGTGIEVTDNKVINLILRSLNNLIKLNNNNEVYVDLQLEDGIENSDTLPIGVNVGRVLQADGRPVTGTLISGQTTSGDRVKVLYGDDGVLRVDNGTGTWKILQYQMSAGTGININNNTISNTGVLSVNGQTGHVSTNPICIIQVSYDGYTTTGTITQGEYVDGAIVILTGNGRIEGGTGLEITIDGETHNLVIYPREGQGLESFSISGPVTGMLKILVIGGVSSDVFLHWRGGEFNMPV